jgi:sulfur transfer complex TusBCD TusB component (DsrH family)
MNKTPTRESLVQEKDEILGTYDAVAANLKERLVGAVRHMVFCLLEDELYDRFIGNRIQKIKVSCELIQNGLLKYQKLLHSFKGLQR